MAGEVVHGKAELVAASIRFGADEDDGKVLRPAEDRVLGRYRDEDEGAFLENPLPVFLPFRFLFL